MAVFSFGEFELDVSRRSLTRNASKVKIGARAFDILACLVSNAGQIVTKDEIIRTVWPATHVDEVALRVHLVALRKAIDDGTPNRCIESVAGRGYQFLKPVTRVVQSNVTVNSAPEWKRSLPVSSERLIGRDFFVAQAADLMRSVRLLTITGPGGIGKTSVALEVARRDGVHRDDVIFLDLTAFSSGSQISAFLASRLGLSVYSGDPLPGVIQALGTSHTLIIFDNCEHLIDDCAILVERLLGSSSNVAVLATSREALRIRSEHVRLLQGLSTPEEGESVNDPAAFGAVELFLERYHSASGQSVSMSSENLELIARIVTRLDGIPLAIELAAARAGSLGIKAVLDALSDPIRLLRRGRRTAPQRQQTLLATLEWSFSLLSAQEKQLLERLSVFAGSFSAKAAGALLSGSLSSQDLEDALAGLCSKCLITVSKQNRSLRLLEVTRAFARDHLIESGAEEQTLGAHAKWALSRLNAAIYDWTRLDTPSWLGNYGGLINDVRVALNWTFDRKHYELALKLTATSHVLWTQLGLMSEQLYFLERAVRAMEGPVALEPLEETRLRASYAAVLFHLKSLSADEEAIRQFRRATLTAEASGDATEIVRAHSGICAILTTHGRYREAVDIASSLESKFGAIANNAASRIYAMNTHFLGDFALSEIMCRQALEAGSVNVRSTRTSGAGYDQRLLAMLVLAKNAWITGATETALQYSREVVAEALNIDDPISTCLVLAVSSCVVYFGMGEFEAARHHLDILHDVSTKHSLARWKEWADGYELLMPGRNPTPAEFEASFVDSTFGPRVEGILTAVGARAGINVVNFALSGDPGWCKAELLRIKGEILKVDDLKVARALFDKAHSLAIEQGAALWRLRAAGSLLRTAPSSEKDGALKLVRDAVACFPTGMPLAEQEMLADIFPASRYRDPTSKPLSGPPILLEALY